tara:strand:- start:444 stop:641 length:198 start_codon:yes stop_codon:yes gene_type:complete
MSWEDEFAWGNNKGEHTLDVIPPVVYTPLKCKVCGYDYYPDNSDIPSFCSASFPIMKECISTEHI